MRGLPSALWQMITQDSLWLKIQTVLEGKLVGWWRIMRSLQGDCCCCLVAKSCLILCDPVDCSSPDSSVHGVFQARILESVAISFSKGSSLSLIICGIALWMWALQCEEEKDKLLPQIEVNCVWSTEFRRDYESQLKQRVNLADDEAAVDN